MLLGSCFSCEKKKKKGEREREVSQISASKINHLRTGGDDMQAQSSEDSTGKTRPVYKGKGKKRSVDCGNSRWCVQQCPHAGKTSSLRFMQTHLHISENKHKHVRVRQATRP